MSPAAPRILVLDDEPEVLTLVSTALKQAGFPQVSTGSSITGARQCWHAQSGNFDLVLIDFWLPEGCAPELLKELLRHKPNLRIIIMSGFREEDPALEPDLLRHAKVLQKPFSPVKLVRLVESCLDAAPLP